jgi:hypothetical protein
MDLESLVDDMFVQPLKGAIVAENMVATKQLIESVETKDTSTKDKTEISVVAESYILELRDGEQYKKKPTLQDIQTWLDAKGLFLDANSVLANILTEGTSWDKKGGSVLLQEVISENNVNNIVNIAVEEYKQDLNKIKWLSR